MYGTAVRGKEMTWTDKRLLWNGWAQELFENGYITAKQLNTWGHPDCVTMPSDRIKRKPRFKLKTVDLTTKEWFDKMYGNTYFAVRMVLNYGMEDAKTVLLPFQYGYGSHSEHMAFKALIKAGYLKADEMNSPSRYFRENKIIYRYQKHENCLQKDVKNWGKE